MSVLLYKDSKHVSDGTSIEHATQEISKYKQVFAIGINCVSPKLVDQALKEFAKYTSKPLKKNLILLN